MKTSRCPWLAGWIRVHSVTTVRQAGLAGVKNGELLERIDGAFDLFITADKNLRYQQNLRKRNIAILELPTNRLPLLKPLREDIVRVVDEIRGNEYRVLQP